MRSEPVSSAGRTGNENRIASAWEHAVLVLDAAGPGRDRVGDVDAQRRRWSSGAPRRPCALPVDRAALLRLADVVEEQVERGAESVDAHSLVGASKTTWTSSKPCFPSSSCSSSRSDSSRSASMVLSGTAWVWDGLIGRERPYLRRHSAASTCASGVSSAGAWRAAAGPTSTTTTTTSRSARAKRRRRPTAATGAPGLDDRQPRLRRDAGQGRRGDPARRHRASGRGGDDRPDPRLRARPLDAASRERNSRRSATRSPTCACTPTRPPIRSRARSPRARSRPGPTCTSPRRAPARLERRRPAAHARAGARRAAARRADHRPADGLDAGRCAETEAEAIADEHGS